ncbi:hypothetical protein BJY16_006397 [Actinoplanes octamycinicus]|uniref:Uncharacterized protein n=1 Tax=Actinoplanes octamycinicus TaxID=135948 RepID=A0A7W7MAC8_9ACTN|nr:hypothetical protein [Actinoplanes octamycinicus]MBB4742938.1 hypothetical protein [Actinoplanes octamycinicus]GIE58210.1 hypothetical protein Aoc01nite_36120 [Actinoplanes octamycinicus]
MSAAKEPDRRWAPWWVYVVPIVAANYVKQYFVQDWPVAVNAAITLVLVGGLIVGITAVYRGMGGAAGPRR